MAVVGVDFGTLNCTISQAKRGSIETVLNEASKRQTPALVSFQGKERFMGVAAVSLTKSNYKNTIVELKRFIGKNWSDPQVQADIKRCPNANAFSEQEGDRIGITVAYNDDKLVLSPEDVCGMMINSLKSTAEFANEGRNVADIVFSVPSFWQDRQRRAFLDAAKIGNVNVLGLINDGTATALSYGIWKSASNQFSVDEAEYVMFVDVGYAAMQVTIAAFYQGRLQIVASAADENLGGRDIDWILCEHFAEEFKKKHGGNVMENAKAVIKLRDACNKAKSTLTPEGVAFANVNVEFLLNETDFNTKLEIETFDELIQPLVDRVADPIERAMEMSGLSIDKIKSVEIVGGTTRVRAIKRRISEVMNLDKEALNFGLSTTLNADEATSRGCALRCAILSPAFRVKEFIISDTVTQPIKLEWDAAAAPAEEPEDDEAAAAAADDAEDASSAAGKNDITILPQGTETPKTRRVTFRRGQPFEVRALYADEKDENKTDLAVFKVSGMPATVSDGSVPRIRVDFRQDEFGLFKVSAAKFMEPLEDESKTEGEDAAKDGEAKDGEAKEGEADKPKKKKFKAVSLQVESLFSKALSSSDVDNAAAREQEFAQQDRLLRETAETRNKLEEYVYQFRDKISGALREFGTDDERSTLSAALDAAEAWIYDEGYDETKEAYSNKLKDLMGMGNKFVDRSDESEGRPAAIAKFQEKIGELLKVANSEDPKYDHIEEEERKKVRDACADAETWFKEVSEKQAGMNTYEDPVLRVADINAKIRDLELTCNPIVNKRKPAPKAKPAEEKKSEEKEAASAENMSTEGGEAEAEGDADADPEAKDQDNGMDVD
ncbi:Heat shock 70 kDa protein [Hondaea fermentalgiana]|uniref:Heat shock 70 kDa protein n=1 Tax=Hondaea fermentalgiana TaxID=2315210 RepID=A0A2R5GLN5_9STRA|nr:Heat shock 70 kDa protein [Hondaea fermentalgiana]|eukprot:GBG31787.1 Heat shock 70 kDa protein [Hondaea fermentalgiana]